MNTFAKILVIILGVLVGLVALAWIGLQIKPKAFAPYEGELVVPAVDEISVPEDLPAPVARYYETIIVDSQPSIESAIVMMRGTLRVNGITFPHRSIFTHDAGQGYHHYMEAAIFGQPLLTVNEYYLAGVGRMEMPFGVVEDEPKINMAANLGLWSETIWLPTVFLTDPRVRWEPIDDVTARLVVPYGEEEDSFTVYFDEETGLIQRMEAMRYREADSEEKILWTCATHEWTVMNGLMIPSLADVTWADQGKPWLMIEVEDIVYNVDVDEYIRASTP